MFTRSYKKEAPRLTRSKARLNLSSIGAVLRRHSLVVLCYSLLAIAFTWPTVANLQSAITGIIDDREYLWNIWWVGTSVSRGAPMFYTTYIFYPVGLSLYFHTLDPLNGVLAIPFQMLFGLTAAYNIMNILWFILAAVGAYALAQYVTANRAASFIAGLIYGFSPYMAFHLWAGQIASLSAGLMPLYLLALLLGLRGRWPFLLLASVLLTMIGHSDWHYLAFSVTITGLVAVYESFRLRRPQVILAVFAKCAGVGALFLALFSPVLIPMIAEYTNNPSAERPIEHSVAHSADLLAFWLPSIFHPLWGDWAQSIFNQLVPDTIVGGIATLGYVALILGLIGVLREWRRSGLFLLIFVAGFLLALGPYLQVDGVNSFDTDLPIPMPFLFFRMLPFMEINRFPSRFVVVAMLALATLAAIGFDWISRQPRVIRLPSGGRAALPALMAALVLFEFWPRPFPMDPTVNAPDVSPFYRQMAADQEDYAILEVPNLKQDAMFYQTIHGKRIFGGRISREKGHIWRHDRLIGALIDSSPPWKDIGVDESPSAARAALACQGVRYVLFYKHGADSRESAGSAALQSTLFADVAPVYDDDLLRAYEVTATTTGEAFWTPARDWHEPEVSPSGTVFRWIDSDTGTLRVYPCGATDVMLRFNVTPFFQARTLQVSLNGTDLGSFALPKDMLTSLEIALTLQPGENQVVFHSSEPPISPEDALGSVGDKRPLSFQFSYLSIMPR
ncbi:hypothetical protein EKD04_011070 [Chloroflexales bacterium ZM16-3]|nr:hypothetical protein [Chloroflexales bacterium ZM16-3]